MRRYAFGMGFFDKLRQSRTKTSNTAAVQQVEVPVLGYPRDGWSWKVAALKDKAVTAAVRESGIEVAPGTHTDEDSTLVVLQRLKGPRIAVTMGSQILGYCPADEVERVNNRVRRVGRIAAVPARLYLHTPEQVARGLSLWTIVVYA